MLERLEALARAAQRDPPKYFPLKALDDFRAAANPAAVIKLIAVARAAHAGLTALHDVKSWAVTHDSPRMKRAQAAEDALRQALAELERE